MNRSNRSPLALSRVDLSMAFIGVALVMVAVLTIAASFTSWSWTSAQQRGRGIPAAILQPQLSAGVIIRKQRIEDALRGSAWYLQHQDLWQDRIQRQSGPVEAALARDLWQDAQEVVALWGPADRRDGQGIFGQFLLAVTFEHARSVDQAIQLHRSVIGPVQEVRRDGLVYFLVTSSDVPVPIALAAFTEKSLLIGSPAMIQAALRGPSRQLSPVAGPLAQADGSADLVAAGRVTRSFRQMSSRLTSWWAQGPFSPLVDLPDQVTSAQLELTLNPHVSVTLTLTAVSTEAVEDVQLKMYHLAGLAEQLWAVGSQQLDAHFPAEQYPEVHEAAAMIESALNELRIRSSGPEVVVAAENIATLGELMELADRAANRQNQDPQGQ